MREKRARQEIEEEAVRAAASAAAIDQQVQSAIEAGRERRARALEILEKDDG